MSTKVTFRLLLVQYRNQCLRYVRNIIMIKKLPINVPLITSSPTIAALFTIITGVDFLDGWVVNNFNNLLYIA